LARKADEGCRHFRIQGSQPGQIESHRVGKCIAPALHATMTGRKLLGHTAAASERGESFWDYEKAFRWPPLSPLIERFVLLRLDGAAIKPMF